MSLFRKEAVAHQGERLTGAISLAQPLSIKLTVVLLVCVAIAILVFLFSAEYSRKETVRGFLMPNKGVIKSFASQGGTIKNLWVTEGDNVTKGQSLATIIVQQNNSNGIDQSIQLTQQLNAQVALLGDEISQHKSLQTQELLNLQTQKTALQNELSKATFNITNIPQQYTLRINNLKRQQVDLQRQLAQVANNYKYTVTASNNGIVTGIQVVEGETLSPSKAQTKPLLHILPQGSELIAELLLPTRSAGFVQVGNTTRLRFDAFPYQRFGFIESKIIRIDQALINPSEIQLPIALQEPVYRLRAKLNQQQMQAFGKAFNLKSGMLFEADIMLEQRTLIEWLLEPIYSLRGRVS